MEEWGGETADNVKLCYRMQMPIKVYVKLSCPIKLD